ncbi:glycoside hydrolase family 2 protein [Alloscardovia theropitheci]|uniref:Glycoside hydrolase family 2 protein n=1 Tax=Alloscardovia theropitheci TaxID=2496842 RepID=A0A4R0QPF6_9BIFI|nr:glycoside hydrolase family 2 TIM barrel-domain containing protein [Alloscardovia theropitheci]TCD54102.1 glycoside hydrolase family 2 protein [Alloscardovia theropitheci]
MTAHAFNTGWKVRPKSNLFNEMTGMGGSYKEVRLPHDAMIELDRDPHAPSGASSGYYPDVIVEYKKEFDVPTSWIDKSITLLFEGIYSRARVYVNGAFVANRPNGYSEIQINLNPYLKYGETNIIKVCAMAGDDSRWYSGAGIYRPATLYVDSLIHAIPNSERITTRELDEESATIEFCVRVENNSRSFERKRVMTKICNSAGEIVASHSSPITIEGNGEIEVRQRLYVDDPQLWSVENPSLYSLEYQIIEIDDTDGNRPLKDAVTKVAFGIRTLSLSPRKGLRINSQPIKLRGACVHHDNGILGAATFGRAEERRIEQLKAAGFNAIRSSHQPASRAMLDACDRLGMLVMDEAFDMWTSTKTERDYSLDMPQWWEKDIESMIAKDYNHPSVILYSIGNELAESGNNFGAIWGRKIAQKVRSLDSSRYVMSAVNTMVSVLANPEEDEAETGKGINGNMAALDGMLGDIATSESTSVMTEEGFDYMDVAGFNYAQGRYELDRTRFPQRVIVGSETYPSQIDDLWEKVENYSHVIGDFTWTGYDYLGEAGVGRVSYPDDTVPRYGIVSGFPWRYAWVGDLDITGMRRPMSFYREIIFGLRNEPYIAVISPEHYGVEGHRSPWSWSDSISSWTWSGYEGRKIQVEVYSDAPEVELMLNGVSLGKKSTGDTKKCLALFDIEYKPGLLEAYAIRNGNRAERYELRSAGKVSSIRIVADRIHLSHKDDELSFVSIELCDDNGTVITDNDCEVSVTVSGAGCLQALGSANPAIDERFDVGMCRTFRGRALAVVRPDSVESGIVTVTVASAGLLPAAVELEVVME